MALRYTYNPETCQYEPIVVTPRLFGRRFLMFIGISLALGVAGLMYFNKNYPDWDETLLQRENETLKTKWSVLLKQAHETSQQLANLEQADDHNYRVILDMEPLPSDIREAGVGGRARDFDQIPYQLIRTGYELNEKIVNRLEIERQSLDLLAKELSLKEKMWASRPAIQPIDNKQLTRLHTIFGMRMHPLLGYVRPHNGLDFSAPRGTPVYATGDGTVQMAYYSDSYGHVVYLDHDYHFETRYAHLTNYIVKEGEAIKRGQIIGYVGNTGTSAGPHLHYEVLYKGTPVNPINFFQRDLNNKEYEKLVEIGSKSMISLD
jgi:murein DD-endopeptidase MepM/ murein hydrolase activator NlpD